MEDHGDGGYVPSSRPTSVHRAAINQAAAAGLAAGDGGRFSPGLSVRRDQMATFVARTLDRITRDRPSQAGDQQVSSSGPSSWMPLRR